MVKVLLCANFTPVGRLTCTNRRYHAAVSFADPSLANIVDLLPDLPDVDVKDAALLLILTICVVLDANKVARVLLECSPVILLVGLKPLFCFYVDLFDQVGQIIRLVVQSNCLSAEFAATEHYQAILIAVFAFAVAPAYLFDISLTALMTGNRFDISYLF